MGLLAKMREWLMSALIGSAVGLPVGAAISGIVTASWRTALAGLGAGILCLVAAIVVAPAPEKKAAAKVLKEARRFPDDTEVEVEGSDTRLDINRRWTWMGRRTTILTYSMKAWDDAFDEIEAEQGISTVPITAYVIYRWWGPMQLADTITVMSSSATYPWPEGKRTTRWGRYRRELRDQWFQARTGQMKVTEAEMLFLAEELRRGKIASG